MERTDQLAASNGVSLRTLAGMMGLSIASLFGYRNGSIPISNKAWSKLEQSEKATLDRNMTQINSMISHIQLDHPHQSNSTLKEEPTKYRVNTANAKKAIDPTLSDVFKLLRQAIDMLETIVVKENKEGQ